MYIRSKLDPEGNGGGCMDTIVFPIVCPECPIDQWTDGIPEEVAMKIFDEKGMVLWVKLALLYVFTPFSPFIQHYQKLLDSIPRHYCPNPRCSTLLQVQEDVNEQPQAVCPSCDFVMCVPCKTKWHEGTFYTIPCFVKILHPHLSYRDVL